MVELHTLRLLLLKDSLCELEETAQRTKKPSPMARVISSKLDDKITPWSKFSIGLKTSSVCELILVLQQYLAQEVGQAQLP